VKACEIALCHQIDNVRKRQASLLKECESWTRLICKGKGEGSKGAVEVSHKY
jgi:hypothetical protein